MLCVLQDNDNHDPAVRDEIVKLHETYRREIQEEADKKKDVEQQISNLERMRIIIFFLYLLDVFFLYFLYVHIVFFR